MTKSDDGLGLLLLGTVGAVAYGAAQGARADDAARAFQALHAEAERRTAEQQEAIRALERESEGLRSQVRTVTDDYLQTKRQLDTTAAARLQDQTEHAAARRNLDAQIADLTRSVEIERVAIHEVRAQNIALEAQLRAATERERTKDQRIADLEAQIREIETRGARSPAAPSAPGEGDDLAPPGRHGDEEPTAGR